METYKFLSDEWIEACRKLRAEYADRLNPPASASIKLNLIVERVPFGDSTRKAYLDTSVGEPEIELGHINNVDATITSDYELVKSVIVDGNMGAALEGMQLGRVRIDGDMFKLMALAGMNADPGSIALAKAIRQITE